MSNENNGQLSNRDKILQAARALMSEKGIKETSLAEIAREAGISKGTLFYYYASKDDLLNDILAEHFTNLVNVSKELLGEQLENLKSSEIVRLRFEQITSHFDITRLDLYLLQEGILGNENIKEKFAQRKRYWRKSIAEDIARVFNISNPAHLSALSIMMLALLDGLSMQVLLEPDNLDLDSLSMIVTEMIHLLASAE